MRIEAFNMTAIPGCGLAEPTVSAGHHIRGPGRLIGQLDLCILNTRQMPDAVKRARADYVIDTGHGIDSARAQVKTIVEELRKQAERTNHA